MGNTTDKFSIGSHIRKHTTSPLQTKYLHITCRNCTTSAAYCTLCYIPQVFSNTVSTCGQGFWMVMLLGDIIPPNLNGDAFLIFHDHTMHGLLEDVSQNMWFQHDRIALHFTCSPRSFGSTFWTKVDKLWWLTAPTLSLASEQTLKDLKRSQGYQHGGEKSRFG